MIAGFPSLMLDGIIGLLGQRLDILLAASRSVRGVLLPMSSEAVRRGGD
jgi:hypothetical protein